MPKRKIAPAITAPADSTPQSLKNARGQTLGDLKNLMSALMADVVEGRVSPQVANKISAKTGKLVREAASANKKSRNREKGDAKP